MKPIIIAENLTRIFQTKSKEKVAVNNISFQVKQGTIFGLLGPNGAGKSTTIKMLTSILLPTSGKLEILGLDIYKEEQKIRPKIGLLYGSEQGFYYHLSGFDNLLFYGSLFKINRSILERRISYWLERVGLMKDKDLIVGKYSKGMKQRLHTARMMLHDPEILFLDEPTLGLDPQGTLELRSIIKEQKELGKTIILTTHDMEEAQELCDEIAFIMDGQFVRHGTLAELQEDLQEKRNYEIQVLKSAESVIDQIKNLALEWEGMELNEDGSSCIRFNLDKTDAGEDTLRQVITILAPFSVNQLIYKTMDLRSIYLKLTEKESLKKEIEYSINL